MRTLIQLNTPKSPREIILEDFEIDLPISGGWGYDLASACVIEKNDSSVNQNIPFNGLEVERFFVEKRIYEEMIIQSEPDQQFSGIKWNPDSQSLITLGTKNFDKLIYQVEGFDPEVWRELVSKYAEIKKTGRRELIPALNNYRDSKKYTFEREFYFDITSFFNIR
ncbi:hypothetical protein [Polynucleobacter rarus]|uniref:hypothetical protein n=1 Tax=Polynucleobacter rarus TaxID=556055 RepID=UPI000D3E7198|nr:hypothetical protein [Polynucleobacter rarus]